MTPTRLAPALLAAAALAACGRSAATVDDFRAAAPTSANLAISQNDGDPEQGDDVSEETATAQSLAAGGECHPHLFVRTHEIIGRVNRHLFKHLHHVEELIAKKKPAMRLQATKRFLNDPRDTGTANGTAQLLARLFKGDVLSKSSTGRMTTSRELKE